MRRLFLFSLLAAVFVSGCSSGGGFSKRESDTKTNVFRYPIVTNPTSLDPAIVQDGDTIDALQQVYECLVQWDENSRPVPNLAERWDVSEDGTTYTFHLKKGVKFHSGREMKADDVKWSIERACAKDFNSATAGTYLSDIVGVREKLAGKADEISGLKVVDESTIEMKIDKPRAYFIAKLTYLVSAVVDKDKVPQSKEITTIAEMVGTGPFTCTNFVPEQIMVLEANASYHGGAVPLSKIERPVIKDALSRLNKYKGGEIDLVQLERQDVSALQADSNYKDQLKFYPRPAIWYVGLNPLVYKPFADKRVRQAFAMAIDRQKIVDQYLGGVNQIATGIVPPAVLGHRENGKVHEFNVEKAKALLAEAGYPGGKGLPTFTITFREQRPDIQIVAEAVASMLKENLGVKAEPQTMEWRAYLEKHNAKQQGLYHMRWAADYLDPENFLSTLLATYGNENKVGYSNPEYDKLCSEADTSLDEGKRLELYAKAEDIVLQDAPFIPIYFQRDAELIRTKVKGLRESAFGHLPHTTVTIE